MDADHPPAVRPHLTRQVTLLPLVGILFFTNSGGAYSLEALVSMLGPGLAILLLVATPLVYALPIAAITTELATMMPAEGGTYVWAKRVLGDFVAFEAGMLRWLHSWVDMAIYPVLFASYLSVLFVPARVGDTVLVSVGSVDLDLSWVVGVVCVITPMALLNIRGVRSVGDSSLVFATIALTPLAIMGGLGIVKLFVDHTNPMTPFLLDDGSGSVAFGAGLALVMWSYIGFDRVGLIAGEIKNPSTVIPKALAYTMLLVVASYVFPLVGAIAAGDWQNWVAGSFGNIAALLAGTWLAISVTIGGMFSQVGQYSSLLMSNSRAVFVLAADGWAPRPLAQLSSRHGTPTISIVVSSVIYALFSLVEFSNLVVIDVLLINLLFMVDLLALMALRIKEPNAPRPTRIPGGWFGVAITGIPLTIAIVFVTWHSLRGYGQTGRGLVFVTLLLSLLAYLPARRYRHRLDIGPQDIHHRPEGRPHLQKTITEPNRSRLSNSK